MTTNQLAYQSNEEVARHNKATEKLQEAANKIQAESAASQREHYERMDQLQAQYNDYYQAYNNASLEWKKTYEGLMADVAEQKNRLTAEQNAIQREYQQEALQIQRAQTLETNRHNKAMEDSAAVVNMLKWNEVTGEQILKVKQLENDYFLRSTQLSNDYSLRSRQIGATEEANRIQNAYVTAQTGYLYDTASAALTQAAAAIIKADAEATNVEMTAKSLAFKNYAQGVGSITNSVTEVVDLFGMVRGILKGIKPGKGSNVSPSPRTQWDELFGE